jgi:hypothetical protein
MYDDARNREAALLRHYVIHAGAFREKDTRDEFLALIHAGNTAL